MTSSLQRTAWLAAATAAALAVPWLGLGDLATGCAAGAVTVLTGAAFGLWRQSLEFKLRGPRLVSISLLLSAFGTAASTLEAGPPWSIAACALGSALILATGLAQMHLSISAEQTELASLRSRLVRREGDVRAQADRIRQLDMHDAATGVLNRRGFVVGSESALARCATQLESAALILIELREPLAGGSAGATHAAKLTHAVNRALRGSDLVGRWDDRTLVALLPCCNDSGPALVRLGQGLSEVIGDAWSCGWISIDADGPRPDVEGLVAAAQTTLQRRETEGQVLPFRTTEDKALPTRD